MVALLNVLVKRRSVVVMLIAMTLLNSCRDPDKNSSLIFEELNWSLENSNSKIGYATDRALKDLEKQTNSPETADKAIVLFTKAKYIHSKSNVLIKFIDSLQKALESNFNGNNDTKNDGKDFSNRLFSTQNMGSQLYDKLVNTRALFLTIDSNAQEYEHKLVTIANQSFMRLYKDGEQFTKVFFSNKPYDEAITNLSKFKNDLLVTENGMIDFLRYRITSHGIIQDYFPQLLTTQNSTHFKPGEELVIKTGIGAYAVVKKQEISINNLNVEVQNGIGIHKMRASMKAGKYKVPVEIKFFGPQGKEEIHSDIVEYSVVE